jgi:hypothetical protein
MHVPPCSAQPCPGCSRRLRLWGRPCTRMATPHAHLWCHRLLPHHHKGSAGSTHHLRTMEVRITAYLPACMKCYKAGLAALACGAAPDMGVPLVLTSLFSATVCDLGQVKISARVSTGSHSTPSISRATLLALLLLQATTGPPPSCWAWPLGAQWVGSSWSSSCSSSSDGRQGWTMTRRR